MFAPGGLDDGDGGLGRRGELDQGATLHLQALRELHAVVFAREFGVEVVLAVAVGEIAGLRLDIAAVEGHRDGLSLSVGVVAAATAIEIHAERVDGVDCRAVFLSVGGIVFLGTLLGIGIPGEHDVLYQ